MGRPEERLALRRAESPPAMSRVMATAPSASAQKSRRVLGGSGFPPDVTISSTSDPLSEEVMKKIVIRSVARMLMMVGKG